MKLRYWHIQCTDDSHCYSIVAKTKKEALRQLSISRGDGYTDAVVELKEFEYYSAFDLFEYATSENGLRGCGETLKTYKIK